MPTPHDCRSNRSKTISADITADTPYDVKDPNGKPATRLVVCNKTLPDAVPANDILLEVTVDGGVDGLATVTLWPRSMTTLRGEFQSVKAAPSSGTVKFWIQASYN